MDDLDRKIIDRLQDGFPISRRPFAEVATSLGLTEAEIIERLQRLRESGVLSRFGPMFKVEGFGGYVSLASMAVPPEDFEQVAELVNAYPQVAHNYARDHALNMWFVVATESRSETQEVLAEIETRTGLTVYDMPKLAEFHVHLRLKA